MEEEVQSEYVDRNYPFEDIDIYDWYAIAMERCKFTIAQLKELNNPTDLTDFLTITEWNDYKNHLIESYKRRHSADPTPTRVCEYENRCFGGFKLHCLTKTVNF